MASATAVAAANIEESVTHTLENASSRLTRPWLLFVVSTLLIVVFVAGGGPMISLLQLQRPLQKSAAAAVQFPVITLAVPASTSSVQPAVGVASTLPLPAVVTALHSPPPPPPPLRQPTCGDGRCEPPETIVTCFADCPGVTTQAVCGEEPHSDPQGNAVVDGRGHHLKTAGDCCDACAAHAAKYPNRPCNSWVFCYMPHCWSADNGNTHLFGECWLKWQTDPAHPLYGQRGKYTDEYRRRNRDKHLNGNYPTDKNSVDAMTPFGIVPGSRRNLTIPTHVSWIGGVMGAKVNPSVLWSTDADGTMRSSAGDVIVDYRPWESREQNLKRGVKPEQMKF